MFLVRRLFVMVPSLDDPNHARLDCINEAVLFVDMMLCVLAPEFVKDALRLTVTWGVRQKVWGMVGAAPSALEREA